jgi:hypothetical protein
MNSSIAKKIWDFVTSRDVAIVLLIIVTIMLASGAFLPNPAFLSPEEQIELHLKHPVLKWLGDRFNSQTLARSKLFGFAGVFLIFSTTLCSIDRLIKRKSAKAGAILSFPTVTGQEGKTEVIGDTDIDKIENHAKRWFTARKWQILSQHRGTDRIIVGIRGSAGFWGSIFFHFILITALMGLVVYYFGAYRATLAFTEGQSYPLVRDNLLHILQEPLWGLSLPEVELGLIKQYSIYPESDPWNATEHVAVFHVREKNGRTWEKTVRINDPLVVEGMQFLLQRGGFSPRIIVRDSAGNTVFENFVALRGDGGTEDSFSVTGTEINIKIHFFPDFVIRGDTPATKSYQVRNPFFLINVYKNDDLVYKGIVPFNGRVRAGAYELAFPEIRRWVEMELVGEPGIGFFFLMSFVGLIGVIVRIIDPDERIYIILNKTKSGVNITTYTYSKHFSGLINEKREEVAGYIREMIQ